MDMEYRRTEEIILALWIIYIFSAPQTNGLDNYEFHLGENASITFTKTMNEQSSIGYTIFKGKGNEPFSVNGTFIPKAMKPSQRRRFQIIANRTNSEFSATLQIRQIEQIDSGVYILSLEESSQDDRISYTLDAYVDVLLPPGRATCEEEQSAYSDNWWLVGCSAYLSSDGGGFIVCYQDGAKAPFMLPPERSATHLSATFWMRIVPPSPFKCCSYDVNNEKDESSCTDFTFDPTSLQEQDPPNIDSDNDNGTTATPFDDGIRNTTLNAISPNYDKPSSAKEAQIPMPDSTINKMEETRPVLVLTVLLFYIILLLYTLFLSRSIHLNLGLVMP